MPVHFLIDNKQRWVALDYYARFLVQVRIENFDTADGLFILWPRTLVRRAENLIWQAFQRVLRELALSRVYRPNGAWNLLNGIEGIPPLPPTLHSTNKRVLGKASPEPLLTEDQPTVINAPNMTKCAKKRRRNIFDLDNVTEETIDADPIPTQIWIDEVYDPPARAILKPIDPDNPSPNDPYFQMKMVQFAVEHSVPQEKDLPSKYMIIASVLIIAPLMFILVISSNCTLKGTASNRKCL
ncbi:hypothetical protein DTO027B5_3711 [Paecilomyces variotii]|nr:hypothetical protein DTO032I3_1336 [Paecilomyces variotii]KAJ9223961.1 hypothetical protein DTO169C6_3581 [Paecilomyces variotii]KAJ9279929.1 hypothetical protein DTO021D3_3157 [Paecilomyces variotii]KAJ9288989.1 hypothetical protein DTO021C3_3514 [Paecilomyces variotii]KAJ9326074.1 hypothetical protein DTO027B3_3050 [Paecilomyces variotii]